MHAKLSHLLLVLAVELPFECGKDMRKLGFTPLKGLFELLPVLIRNQLLNLDIDFSSVLK